MTVALPEPEPATAESLARAVSGRLRHGARFAGLMASHDQDDATATTLTAALAARDGVELLDATVGSSYPSLTRTVPAAFWYERAVHDLFGPVPEGHPRLDPLLLPLDQTPVRLPRPGATTTPPRLVPDERAVPRHVVGHGLFTIPHGPVRSGVMESVEYLVETPGEDIPHLQVRVFAKHRGVERTFQGRRQHDGVLLAERVEGVASVAHALAFCHAVETLADVDIPPGAALLRVVHAELERIANHLDVAVKLADAAGLAVAVARFSWHKEQLLRERSRLCGNRFGRGVVVPGGVEEPAVALDGELLHRVARIEHGVLGDARALMGTSSFLDRVRGTGPLTDRTARELGALGPVARGSGYHDDARWRRPYDAYPRLHAGEPSGADGCDAMARLRVRWDEIAQSFDLVRQSVDLLRKREPEGQWRRHVPAASGRAAGWAEAPQGEVLYVVDLVEGRVARCWPRSASFHNLMLFHEVFAGDVLTDFPFIEASFGLSIAGVAY